MNARPSSPRGSSGELHATQELLEARVAAQRVVVRLRLELEHAVVALVDPALQPVECSVAIAECGHRPGGVRGRHVAAIRLAERLRERALRLLAETRERE